MQLDSPSECHWLNSQSQPFKTLTDYDHPFFLPVSANIKETEHKISFGLPGKPHETFPVISKYDP